MPVVLTVQVWHGRLVWFGRTGPARLQSVLNLPAAQVVQLDVVERVRIPSR